MSNCIVIPLKNLGSAKTRLSTVLIASERADFGFSMFQDVLAASARTRGVEKVIVVTPDERAATLARIDGAELLPGGQTDGLNSAVRSAINHASTRGFDRLLVVHADIPLIQPSDLLQFFQTPARIMIAPSRDLDGTNALLLSPPDVIQPRYGRKSFETHLGLAREKGIEPIIVRNENLALDVDTPQDLVTLCERTPKGYTGTFLHTHQIEGRLRAGIKESAILKRLDNA